MNLKKYNKILIVLFFNLIGLQIQGLAQKKLIDTTAIQNWESLGYSYGISGNGKYVYYSIESFKKRALIVTDVTGRRERRFTGGNGAQFSADSKYLILNAPEGLVIFSLEHFKAEVISNAGRFKLSNSPSASFITYISEGKLFFRNLRTKKFISLGKTEDYTLNGSGTSLVVKHPDGLDWIDIPGLKKTTIYNGKGVGSVVFDATGTRIVFPVSDSGKVSIYKFLEGAGSATLLIAQYMKEFNGRILSGDGLGFNKNGDLVFFNYKQIHTEPAKDRSELGNVVHVWNYKDRFLELDQEWKIKDKQGTVNPDYLYHGIKAFAGGKTVMPESLDTLIFGGIDNHWALLKSVNNDDEVYWNEKEWPEYKLLSLSTGKAIKFLPYIKNVYNLQISSSEKFVTWVDSANRKYFSYEIETRKVKDITKLLLETAAMADLSSTIPASYAFEGWLKDDTWIMATDYHDMWLIDPLGEKKTICVTAGLGRKNGCSYRPVLEPDELKLKNYGDELIFATLELTSKNSGFAKAKLLAGSLPVQLSSGPYLDYFPVSFDGVPKRPVKASKANIVLLERQSDRSSKNLFVTHDFKTFKQVSDIHPEKDYKWFSGKMIHFTTRNGESREGILYQPDDLDTAKKYPIIFNYYEWRTDERFKFLKPEVGMVNINVPWYINRGYLVFVPNIHRRSGDLGESAVQTVVSAAEYITRTYPWIDKTKMGLQGQSYGGTVTNYLVTHTNIFAAAQSSSGRSNHISMYGGTGFGGKSLQAATEEFQNNMKVTPWDNPDVYIRNSAIFGIAKTTTPLLIMHGRDDSAVAFSQAVELFTGLRRAKKRVWLLEYHANHVIGGDLGRDFTIRQQQFFDHYLKGTPAPLWMVEGIPAKYRGIKSGLQLDSLNRIP